MKPTAEYWPITTALSLGKKTCGTCELHPEDLVRLMIDHGGPWKLSTDETEMLTRQILDVIEQSIQADREARLIA